MDAIDMRAGDVLLLRSGEQAEITLLVIRHARLPVYNFQVEDLHSYAVGSAQILVHNNSGWGAGTFGSAEESFLKHFEVHGAEVGATTPAEYAAKAAQALLSKKGMGVVVDGATPHVRRYPVHGTNRYVDIDTINNVVISFGTIKGRR